MNLSEVLNIECIEVKIQVDDKDDLLEKLMDLAIKSGKVIDKETALKEIYNREKIMSTGVGKGIALPHAKTDAVSDSIAVITTLKEGIDFDSIDDEEISIAMMILGKEKNVGNHLRLLSKISRYLNNDSFRLQIKNSKSSEEILNLFLEKEEAE